MNDFLNIYKTFIQPLKLKYVLISDLFSEQFNHHFYLKEKKNTVGLGKKRGNLSKREFKRT